MAKLINRYALFDAIRNITYNSKDADAFFEEVLEVITEQPTTTEAEIRAMAIDEFAERCKELVKQGELYDYVRWCNWNNSVFKWFDRVVEQLKEEQ
jgi:hypothetical protein